MKPLPIGDVGEFTASWRLKPHTMVYVPETQEVEKRYVLGGVIFQRFDPSCDTVQVEYADGEFTAKLQPLMDTRSGDVRGKALVVQNRNQLDLLLRVCKGLTAGNL